jgi:hypothetical protein
MDSAATFKRLRVKTDPTADDRDWVSNVESPNRITAVVGGTTTAGTYSITVTGFVSLPSGRVDVNFTASFVRAAENDNTIADELENDFDAGRANSALASSPTLASLGIVADVSSATITITAPPNAYLTFTSSAPGTGTITWALGTVLPITAASPLFDRGGEVNANVIIAIVHQRNSSGVSLAPGSGTVTMQAIEVAEIADVASDGSITYRYVNCPLAAVTGVALNLPQAIPLRGAKYWTVRITSDANLSGSATDLEVVYRNGLV